VKCWRRSIAHSDMASTQTRKMRTAAAAVTTSVSIRVGQIGRWFTRWLKTTCVLLTRYLASCHCCADDLQYCSIWSRSGPRDGSTRKGAFELLLSDCVATEADINWIRVLGATNFRTNWRNYITTADFWLIAILVSIKFHFNYVFIWLCTLSSIVASNATAN